MRVGQASPLLWNATRALSTLPMASERHVIIILFFLTVVDVDDIRACSRFMCFDPVQTNTSQYHFVLP